MNIQILFSVIIPAYNREHFLKKAVDSVLTQTYGNFELIVIDDGSTDNTKSLLSSYSDNRIKYIKNKTNSGVSKTRNKGLNIAKGNFIAFLDSDDWWKTQKLEKTINYITKFPDIPIFHSEEIWYRNGKLLNQKKKHKKPSEYVYKEALPICCISISTAVIKKCVFDSIGTFDETFEACEDYDFWLRTTARYKVKLIPEALTLKDGGRSDQLSSSVWGLDRFRIKALEKMLLSKTLTKEQYSMTFMELEKKCGIFSNGAKKRGNIQNSLYYKSLPDKYRI
ncbi:MAG: glycosyltransferase family A protein [Candidatus Omnitrophota bacterium]